MTYFQKNNQIRKSSDHAEIKKLENDGWTKIEEEEYLKLTAEADAKERLAQEEKSEDRVKDLPPITDNLVVGVKFNAAGVQHNANSIRSNRWLGYSGLIIGIVALITAFGVLFQPKYDDKVLSEKVAAIEAKSDDNTAAITDANTRIADAASAATDAIAKLRGDTLIEFNTNRGVRVNLANRLDTAEADLGKANTARARLTKAIEKKVSWKSLEKVENTAAAVRKKIWTKVNNNEQVTDVALKEAIKNTAAVRNIKRRLVVAEGDLIINRAAILDVANRADIFIKSAEVTRSWFLGKPRLEGEKGVFDAPIFDET